MPDMTTQEAAELWDLSQYTVSKYCKEGKIPDAVKISGKWRIPKNSVRPVTDKDLRKILFLTLQLKNNPEYEIDYDVLGLEGTNIKKVYDYLHSLKLIEKLPEGIPVHKIPYKAVLTKRGMSIIENGSKGEKSSSTPKNIQKTVLDWGPAVIHLVTEIFKYVN